jgi:hypothetical protein
VFLNRVQSIVTCSVDDNYCKANTVGCMCQIVYFLRRLVANRKQITQWVLCVFRYGMYFPPLVYITTYSVYG